MLAQAKTISKGRLNIIFDNNQNNQLDMFHQNSGNRIRMGKDWTMKRIQFGSKTNFKMKRGRDDIGDVSLALEFEIPTIVTETLWYKPVYKGRFNS